MMAIETKDLSYCYPRAQGQDTLQGLSFYLEPGQVYGFLGPSGAGKSTTQKILYRLLEGYRGRLSIWGRDLATWKRDLFKDIGIGFETPNLFPKLSGWENLSYAASLRGGDFNATQVQAMAERLGMADALDKRADQYSKGMAMRLSFLRAVQHKPRLLFLDEPTSGLDPVWARVVKDWIIEIASQGTAVFLTTHDMTVAQQVCHRVGLLVEGRLVAQGTPQELCQSQGVGDLEAAFLAITGTYLGGDMPDAAKGPEAARGKAEAPEGHEAPGMAGGARRTTPGNEATGKDAVTKGPEAARGKAEVPEKNEANS